MRSAVLLVAICASGADAFIGSAGFGLAKVFPCARIGEFVAKHAVFSFPVIAELQTALKGVLYQHANLVARRAAHGACLRPQMPEHSSEIAARVPSLLCRLPGSLRRTSPRHAPPGSALGPQRAVLQVCMEHAI